MAALSGWVSIRRFLGVPLMKSLPLKTPTTRRLYEEKRHARHQLQAQNGTTDGASPPSGDNTLGLLEPTYPPRYAQVRSITPHLQGLTSPDAETCCCAPVCPSDSGSYTGAL